MGINYYRVNIPTEDDLRKMHQLQYLFDNPQIMKKELTKNVYTDAWINKNNELVIGDAIFECDITQLLKGSHVDDELYLISKEGKVYDLDDADVIAEVGIDNVEIYENTYY